MNKIRNMLFMGWVGLILGLYLFTIILGLAIGRLVSIVLGEL